MNNRLGSLPEWVNEPFSDSENEDENEDGEGEGDVEEGKKSEPKPKTKEEQDKEVFFEAIELVQKEIGSITKATSDIERINEQAQKALTTEKETELSRKLRKVIDSSNKRAKGAKNLLGELKKENEDLKEKKEVPSSDMRVRENLLNTLTRKFIDEMKLYQGAQTKYKADIQKKMRRQVKVVKPNATEDEIEEVLKSPGGRDELYKATILAGGVNDDIKTATAKVAGKYQDVKALEQSVQELHQMFLDFALLVEQQGELLNNIEHQVRQAADHIEEGNKDIVESLEIQKSIRKKQMWIILIVIVVLIIILFSTGIISF